MRSVQVLDSRDRTEINNDIDHLLTTKANRTELPTQASQVNADPAGTASSMVYEHNVDTGAHPDIRAEVNDIELRVETIEESMGSFGYMKIGKYSFIPNSDGHLTLVYVG